MSRVLKIAKPKFNSCDQYNLERVDSPENVKRTVGKIFRQRGRDAKFCPRRLVGKASPARGRTARKAAKPRRKIKVRMKRGVFFQALIADRCLPNRERL
jgi:hypothetical protein